MIGGVGGIVLYDLFSSIGEGTSKGNSVIPFIIAVAGGALVGATIGSSYDR